MKKKDKFITEHENLTTDEYKLELLYSQQIIINKLEKIRFNTSSIVWIIVIGIVLTIFNILTSTL